MTVANYNWTWEQGADLVMSFVYKEGPDGEEAAKNLTGYSLRMDVLKKGARVFTFNSHDIPGNEAVDVVGPADNEVVLGADGAVTITVPRSLTLPGGAVFAVMETGKPLVLDYDIFLRNSSNKQDKILRGTIVVNGSYTLWQ